MRKYTKLILFCLVSLLLLGKGIAFSQSETVRGGVVPEYGPDSEMLWLWGPVVSVDSQNNQVVVRYFDYENDQEKEMTLVSDDKTNFENIRSLGDIKVNDALSIDYMVGVDGRNVARNISVEKPEESMLPTEETADQQPKK